ncbi:MAG: extracellular solute-binding protein [Candidatus Symbiobacter sp.]|nr:extracellular solute-binding protein [Candidatus Symbiobacter sp.]
MTHLNRPRPRAHFFAIFALMGAVFCLPTARPATASESGGGKLQPALSLYGDVKYKPGFDHFDYLDPKAPKGGLVRMAAIGTFDSLNPYILKGNPAGNIYLTFDTLTVQSDDEPYTLYGLLADGFQLAPDRSYVIYHLRPEAKFADGSKLTAADVVFSFNLLRQQGRPIYASYWADVSKIEALDPARVKFTLANKNNRELPMVVGSLPVLSQKWFESRKFDETSLSPILGSGPYQVGAVDPGRAITYERRPDYWGRDLAVNRGRFNFDQIRIDYYRDDTVALEALKSGALDLRIEPSSKNWAIGYESPALASGKLVKTTLPTRFPAPMQGLVYNLRRPIFADARVRAALAYCFDFEWSNQALFYNAYKRTDSYFMNSTLAAPKSLPSKAELAILTPLKGGLPPEVFSQIYAPPKSDGSGVIRDGLKQAINLLSQAGWVIKNGKLVNEAGQEFTFEILLNNPLLERIILPFTGNLERIGIRAKIRTVDPSQYQARVDKFDYDMMVGLFTQSLSPGNEQRNYWSSAAAKTDGSQNLSGLANPAIDKLVEILINSRSRKDLESASHALDRALLWSHILIPMYYIDAVRVAHWNRYGHAATLPWQGFDLEGWYLDPTKIEGK